MKNWKNKRVAVLGLGVDTADVVPFLESQGASITVLDEKKAPFGDLSKYDTLVRSPGVYRYRPEIVAAEAVGVEVTSKMKIFFDVCPARVVGVTGTKGKGTTTTLIYEMVKGSGKEVYLGGNIGQGMFDQLDAMKKDEIVVLEMSSFQLVDLHKSPEVAVVLMVTVEHQDWHENENEYVMAKANICRFQTEQDWVIYNRDYANTKKIADLSPGKKVAVSRTDWTGETRLRGEHNRENLAAAAAAAKILGVSETIIKQVAADFRGLEHRLEEVGVVKGIGFYNDSFSTVPETTIAAIKAFSEPMVLIAGGSEKNSDFTELGKEIANAENVKAVILIGKMAARIKTAMVQAGAGNKAVDGPSDMQSIVKTAAELANSGDVVILSPGAASFDMFANYKDRGEQFRREVQRLLG